ncbi:MAG: hypothetical protein AAGH40_10465 [Verrucomicrobiota bacterium]
MSKIFDKLILVIALLILGGGIAIFVLQSGSSTSDILDRTPSGGTYETIESPPFVEATAQWPAAKEQEPDVVYDVFTPPKIYLDKEGRFVFEGQNITPPQEWTIYLAAIEQKPYRIQLEGYIEEDLSDPSKTLLLLFDEEKKESLRGRVGNDKEDYDLMIQSFNIERVGDAVSGTLRKIATATIIDKRTGAEVILTHGERLFEDEVTITFKSDEDPSYHLELSNAGEQFQSGDDSFILKEIYLEESSVSVEKLASDTSDTETKILTARTTQTSEDEPTATEPLESSSAASEFEGIFN